MKLLAYVGVAALAGAGLLSGPAGAEPRQQQRIEWKQCQLNAGDALGKELDEAGAQCADITVPLDYARPSGRTITVAISRLPATDTKRRIGTLLINGGGPGAPAIDMPPSIREAMGEVGERFDLVGMDPRFVGRSTPLDCGWSNGTMLRSAGPDRASFERAVAFSRSLAAKCGEHAGDVLPHVTTRNTARDMDVIRALLGERKLSYLGYSYGSYLGAVYAEMFPHRVGRLVLDGPAAPELYTSRLLQYSGPANEKALADWASWAAERDSAYGLGRTRAEVLATVHGTIAAAARQPLRVGDYRVDVNLLPVIYFGLVGNDHDGPRAELAEAVRVFSDAVEQGSTEPTNTLAELLLYLQTEAGSEEGSVEAAIFCGDVAEPGGGVEEYWRDIERDRAAMPFASAVVHNLNACEFWPTAPVERPTRVDTTVPALIVAADGDPRTIYANVEPMRRALGKETRLVTLRNANTHGVFAEDGNACVDNAVNAYLASGKLPSSDLECDRDAPQSQSIEWKQCQLNAGDALGKELDEAGAQCADITVPLDYARPGGRTITVALSRLLATDTKNRIGALLVDGGGPGGINLDMPLQVRPTMGKLGERYDLIGIDPRSVGRSTPVDCGWPTGSMHRSAGPDRASFERSVTFSRSLAAKCGERAADVLPHISTRNIARDMDMVRTALDERKVSFLGYSHGSYVGAVYAQLFPHRLDRFVLDGPMDPSRYGSALLMDAGPANEKALADWAAWAAARDATYGLGRTQAEVLATVNDLLAAAAERPLRVGEFEVGSSVTPALLFSLLGSDLDGPRAELAEVVRVLVAAAEHGSAEPTEALAGMLRFLLTGAESGYGSAQAAILCGDTGRRASDTDVENAWRQIERSRAVMPFAAPVVHNLNACDFWPFVPREPLTKVDNDVPALIVAADGDPRTVHAYAQPLRRALGDASRIVTLRGANHHGTYARYGNACVDNAVNAYLASGKLPRRDLECHRI